MSRGYEVGLTCRWEPGGLFASANVQEKGGTKVKSVRVSSVLFADDTSIIVGMTDESVNVVKRVMNKQEERNNGTK